MSLLTFCWIVGHRAGGSVLVMELSRECVSGKYRMIKEGEIFV